MQMLKSLVIMIGVVAHTPAANTQAAKNSPESFYMTPLSESQLEAHCSCDIEIHPLYRATRISISGDNITEFIVSEKACGFLGVNQQGSKGWLFRSGSCESLILQKNTEK
jgi:hypothetical protein